MKKKTNKKTILIVLITLIIICLLCGTLGLIESKKEVNPNKPGDKKDYKVTYRYYLDGEEIEEMPELEEIEIANPDFEGSETTIPKYKYERYTCTNEVTGEFDEEKWEFNPDLTNNTTCRLYFLNTIHEVTVKVSNGKLPSNNPEEIVVVELEKDATINVLPNDGYKFEGVNCTNEVIGEYNEETKDLKISNVNINATCTITYTISDYTAEVQVQNGTVLENKKSANYGSTINFKVTPAENYTFDKVNCTNEQKATYNEETLTIKGLTNDTICTIEFKASKYKVKLNVENGKIIDGKNTLEKSEGQSAMFEVKANEGYSLTKSTIDCGKYDKNKVTFNNGYFTIPNVTEDITCNLTLKEAVTE